MVGKKMSEIEEIKKEIDELKKQIEALKNHTHLVRGGRGTKTGPPEPS